ncbi:MAG: hypothetical protein ACI9FW_002087 [Flavobacterium sp.]|jgi:hypothetical protein
MKIKFNIILLGIFFMQISFAQNGCTDPLANNYDISATINDGSCTYNATSISPTQTFNLSNTINETSGLIEWNNFLYTHNDNSDINLYEINKNDGSITQNLTLNGLSNIDWEEISQDATHIYIGDFGNNSSGNRTNLKIYKIEKTTLYTSPQIEVINFNYSNQTDFSPQSANTTDFDCEAFVVTNSEILLFTKQWTTEQTAIYNLPKTAGTHTATLLTTLNVSGLITGATLVDQYKIIALSGYSSSINPFIYLIYDYNNTNFQNANKRKLTINLALHQIEAISSTNGYDFFLSSESLIYLPFVNNPQKMFTFSLNNYLSDYISNYLNIETTNISNNEIIIFPNPTKNFIEIEGKWSLYKKYKIVDVFGKTKIQGTLDNQKIELVNIEAGIYFMQIEGNKSVFKIIKK